MGCKWWEMLPTARGGVYVHCNVLPPLAPWGGTSELGTGISYQQRPTPVAAFQLSLSTIMQIISLFLW